jgi:hypothetical protein
MHWKDRRVFGLSAFSTAVRIAGFIVRRSDFERAPLPRLAGRMAVDRRAEGQRAS